MYTSLLHAQIRTPRHRMSVSSLETYLRKLGVLARGSFSRTSSSSFVSSSSTSSSSFTVHYYHMLHTTSNPAAAAHNKRNRFFLIIKVFPTITNYTHKHTHTMCCQYFTLSLSICYLLHLNFPQCVRFPILLVVFA